MFSHLKHKKGGYAVFFILCYVISYFVILFHITIPQYPYLFHQGGGGFSADFRDAKISVFAEYVNKGQRDCINRKAKQGGRQKIIKHKNSLW